MKTKFIIVNSLTGLMYQRADLTHWIDKDKSKLLPEYFNSVEQAMDQCYRILHTEIIGKVKLFVYAVAIFKNPPAGKFEVLLKEKRDVAKELYTMLIDENVSDMEIIEAGSYIETADILLTIPLCQN